MLFEISKVWCSYAGDTAFDYSAKDIKPDNGDEDTSIELLPDSLDHTKAPFCSR